MSKDLNLEDKLKLIKSRTSILAKVVRNVLDINQSDTFLQTIYTPFIAYFMAWDLVESKRKLNGRYITNLNEMTILAEGGECRGDPDLLLNELQGNDGNYNLVLNTRLNRYEKFVYSLFKISYVEIKSIPYKEDIVVQPDLEAREILRERLSVYDDYLMDLVELLPLSLFERLKSETIPDKLPVADCHWLGQIFNENYLFFLANLKERGTFVVAQPHGGVYCQVKGETAGELAERILADIYHTPSWDYLIKAFPNWRASRNLFLQLKNIMRRGAKKHKMLVLLGHIYIGPEPRSLKPFTGDILINEFYDKQLRNLRAHFSASFDFKLYVRQQSDVLPKINFLKKLYPDCEFIITSRSVLDVSKDYDGVIHMDTWGTAIIELATSRKPQYVYVGPELLITKEYEQFLCRTKKASSMPDYSKGAYVLVDNKKYRTAYGASFLYPFYFANLIKKMARQFKDQQGSKQLEL